MKSFTFGFMVMKERDGISPGRLIDLSFKEFKIELDMR